MREQVVFEKGEFDKFFLKFVQNLKKDFEKGYGYKMITRDTWAELSSIEEMYGALKLTWDKTIDEMTEK